MKVYIGWDKAEADAYNVAAASLERCSGLVAEPLEVERLRSVGLLQRPVDDRGQKYDFISNAPCSTDFAASRFLVPILCQSGWALFTDCDMVFHDDPRKLLDEVADSKYAVQVVKHQPHGGGTKMGGMVQTTYPRKNWSSVILFNCDHPANQRLTLYDVNNRPGRSLHAFYWLHDSEIGELPSRWNWLVNVEAEIENPAITHFTKGGPWLSEWAQRNYDDIWLKAYEETYGRPYRI